MRRNVACAAYGSRYGFGTAYFEVDDRGIYLSSLALTVLAGFITTIGIILFTLVVTLAVMLGKCQNSRAPPNACASFALNTELNNLQGQLVPKECKGFVEGYVASGQYLTDFAGAVEAARAYLLGLEAGPDARDLVVLDIDETVLSNVAYYEDNNYGWVVLSLLSQPSQISSYISSHISISNHEVEFLIPLTAFDLVAPCTHSPIFGLLKSGFTCSTITPSSAHSHHTGSIQTTTHP